MSENTKEKERKERLDHFVHIATTMKKEPILVQPFLQTFLGKDKKVENARIAFLVWDDSYALAKFEATIDGEDGVVNFFFEG